MHMNTWRNIIARAYRSLLPFLFLLIMSCEEWTPEAEGYYVIDGKRYNIHVMVIKTYPFSNSIEILLQGAPAFYVDMIVSVPAKALNEGTYDLSYGLSPSLISWMSILRGNIFEEITSASNSEGSMTVKMAGDNYVLNFDGKLGGSTVQFYYSGLAAKM
jgi:hypothetical protein